LFEIGQKYQTFYIKIEVRLIVGDIKTPQKRCQAVRLAKEVWTLCERTTSYVHWL